MMGSLDLSELEQLHYLLKVYIRYSMWYLPGTARARAIMRTMRKYGIIDIRNLDSVLEVFDLYIH